MWVHRKGFTLARKETVGIILGSQGTSSYIVQGLGNEASMQSCSYGVGRCMTCAKAIKNLDFAREQDILIGKVCYRMTDKSMLDEATSAYKNIDGVMDAQKDLVKILVELTLLGGSKGPFRQTVLAYLREIA